LFNQYADVLGYFEICLEIFQAADFRQTSEIAQCWEAIIKKEHDAAREKESGESFEGVADTIRRLGRRFLKYELIFNPPTLVPMIEKYNLETAQRDGWVPEAFLDAGMSCHYPTHCRCPASYIILDIRWDPRSA